MSREAMEHLLVFLYMAAFAAGAAAVTLSYQLYRAERSRYLLDYFHFLLLLTVIAGIFAILAYREVNLSGSRVEPVILGLRVVGFGLVAALVYKLIAFVRGLVGRKLSAFARGAYVAAVVLLVLGIVVVSAALPDETGYSRLEPLAYALLTGAAIAAMLWTLVGAGSLPDKGWRKAVRTFTALHLAIYVSIPGAALLPAPLAQYGFSIGFILLSLIPLLSLRRFLQHRRAADLTRPEHAPIMDAFVSRYGISPRERDIVALVLDGRTNVEIAEALCISASTVKNHVYNVYRKVGVRSRMQLANLIRDRSATGNSYPLR